MQREVTMGPMMFHFGSSAFGAKRVATTVVINPDAVRRRLRYSTMSFSSDGSDGTLSPSTRVGGFTRWLDTAVPQYVCMYACMYVDAYVCLWMSIHMYVCLYVCT